MQGILSDVKIKCIVICILIIFLLSCFINISSINVEECNCEKPHSLFSRENDRDKTANVQSSITQKSHRLAIIVPFRDRFEELLQFAPHIQRFLSKQNLDFHIFVFNQVDKYRFNRASLINVGFLYVENKYDYIAMHDVDLLPLNDELHYSYPAKGPFHVSSPELHPRYHYSTFVGGILLIKREHFILVNGMSNKYWGWGLEDDEFYVRLKEAGLGVTRPQNITTGINNSFKHIHDRNHRKRDMTKCYNQREVTRKRDRQTGLSNVSYKIANVIPMTIGEAKITFVSVSLNCNKTITPWCECSEKTR